MSDTEDNKNDDVEMADAATADAEEDAPKKKAAAAGKAPRFEIKKWNAVVSITLVAFIVALFYYGYFCCFGVYRCEWVLLRGRCRIIIYAAVLSAGSDKK